MEKHYSEAEIKLFEAIARLNTVEECAAFFEDICTIKELQDISQRLEVAAMLHDGKNYQEISKHTGASTATICRVNKCLLYGSGGYRTVLGDTKKGETR
jgi:TrpR-related protein YerC/YecD